MSYQERRSLFNLILTVLFTVIYGVIVLNRYNNGLYDTSNMMKFWSTIILVYIPLSIVARIVAAIIHRIFGEITDEITGNKEDRDVMDERDKLIELKSDRISQFVFVFGFIIALFTQLYSDNVSLFFIAMLAGGVIGEVFGNIMQIIFYRRGI